MLDGSKDARIAAFLDAAGEPFLPIDPNGRVPIYVLEPSTQSRLLNVMIKDGWGHGWCSYFIAQSSLAEACLHLGRYLTLRSAHGRPLTSRFWDSRILRVLVPLMQPEEATSFFGPFARIVVEGETPDAAIEFALTPRGARQQTVVL